MSKQQITDYGNVDAKLTAKPVNPEDIFQPILKETFIETSVDDEGRRTGHRATKLIGADGKEVSKDEAEAHKTSVEKDAGSESIKNDPMSKNILVETPVRAAQQTDDAMQANTNTLLAHAENDEYEHSRNIPVDPDTGGFKLNHGFQKQTHTQLTDNGGKEALEEPTEKSVPEPEPNPTKIAVILKFTLGTSQYATMALRELMSVAGVKTYKPDFSSGR